MMRRWLCVCAAVFLLMGILTAGAEEDFVFSFMPTREYDGVTYEARTSSSLTTLLLIGYDHMDEGALVTSQEGFIEGGQSDFLLLLVIDHDNEEIRQLQIDRDTMTDVMFYSKSGVYYGTRKLQICLSHAYGDTQEKNNRNTIWAVENLLGIAGDEDGAQIDWYMAMDITGIGRLNELLGGVTVPINDDFSYYDPTMIPGTEMKLNGDQAEIYCRQRYYIGEQTNQSRMVRQHIYMSAATDILHDRLKENQNFAAELMEGMGLIFDTTKTASEDFGFTVSDHAGTPVTDTPTHYIMTNRSLEAIVALMARVADYTVHEVELLSGAYSIGMNGYMEYNVEQDAGLKWALDAFYRPLN